MNRHAHAAGTFAALCLVATASCAHDQPAQAGTTTSANGSAPAANGGSNAAKSVSVGAQTEVLLCDGQTKVNVNQGTPGSTIAGALMTEWLRKNPNANWEAEERERHTLQPAADNAGLVGQVQGQTYGLVSQQDVALWKSEAERTALAGSQVFHSADLLGSTIGVSCDMCHPHAANTHPETYPKFQAQLGRVALLRDMINWCLQHPVRAKGLEADDPKMRALEAYILAQRKGHALEYGKH
jgi:thiosulfate dehydrogenase